MSARDDDDKTARQIARSKQKRTGDRSAQLANELMKLPGHLVAKLTVDDDLREAIDRARAVTSHIARRRAERTLAGDLRRFELGEVEAALTAVAESGGADVRQFHLAEQWRTKLIEEGVAALETFPAPTDDELPRLIAAAQRERDTGRPPGAAKALFRHIATLLKS
jgi:ribosome-associated protein